MSINYKNENTQLKIKTIRESKIELLIKESMLGTHQIKSS